MSLEDEGGVAKHAKNSSDLGNPGWLTYESVALPLSYPGVPPQSLPLTSRLSHPPNVGSSISRGQGRQEAPGPSDSHLDATPGSDARRLHSVPCERAGDRVSQAVRRVVDLCNEKFAKPATAEGPGAPSRTLRRTDVTTTLAETFDAEQLEQAASPSASRNHSSYQIAR